MNTLHIVQFRSDFSERHEQSCYVEDAAHVKDALVFHNALTGELPKELPEHAGGVILGGSGELMLSDTPSDAAWLKQTNRLIDHVLERNIPILGICFGSQLLANHQGAKIVAEPSMAETGTFSVNLLAQASTDPLFAGLKQSFDVQLGHKDTPINLPVHLVPLAYSDRVSAQAFKHASKDAWGVVFHPELNQARMRTRVEAYPNYVPEGQTVEDLIALFHDTPEAAKILKRFINLAFQR